jgi:hypothetical protein
MIHIVSNRKYCDSISWQIVHEWEEDFQQLLNTPMIFEKQNKKNIFQKIRYHAKLMDYIPTFNCNLSNIIFHMVAPYEYNYYSSGNYVPIIIDAWKHELERIQKFCKFNPCVFLGSLEAVIELKSRGVNNVYYLPVSISKKYTRPVVAEKNIDLIMYGRNHVQLKEWVEKLSNKSQLNIIQCHTDIKGDFCAWSNKTGLLGPINQRYELMDLIARSKYTVVSSPGNDLQNKADILRTGGYSPITPRFFEAAVNYSVGVGIFPHNPDYSTCNIEKISIAVDTFEAFEMQIHTKPDFEQIKVSNDLFLEDHWTEKRLATILSVIKSI